MELRLLGPVQAQTNGRPINLGVRMQRLVLALLALETNRLITTERLIDLAWPSAPPRTARRIIHSQISRLRATLTAAADPEPVTIRSSGPGYLLDCPPERIDAHHFAALLAQARHTQDDHTRLRLLDEALALWRGPALADVATDDVRTLLGGHLEQSRLYAIEQRLDTLLHQGQHLRVVEEASRLSAENPDRHRLTGHLMLALHRTGHTAEALNAYQQARRRLTEEYGLDPPAELRELETAILRGAPAPNPPHTRTHRPAQLPADLPTFTGRATALAQLRATLPDTERPPGPPIAAIDGMAGIGKTRLAVHAAHQLVAEGRYPDGQLYVNLQAYSPTAAPAQPDTVLDTLLRALGTPPEQIPANLDARSTALRDRLATRRMILVLDNASNEDQVTPLLPASPTCLVIVTSRRTLALEGSRAIRLAVFSDAESIQLLTAVIGRARVSAEPTAASELARHCAGLPLAVAIAAHRLRARPGWPIAHLVTHLDDQNRRLGALAIGSRTVEAVFALSYQALTPTQQRVFRLLGDHPGNDVTVESAAALLEADPTETEDLLESLLDEHLLHQSTPHRYHLHDLLRVYALRLGRAEESEQSRQAAVGRLLTWYLHAADQATRTLHRLTVPMTLDVPAPKTPLPALDDPTTAMTWLDTEYPNLIAALRVAAAGPWYRYAVLLPHLLRSYFTRRTRRTDWLDALHLALSAARALDDGVAEAYTLTELGQAHVLAGATDRALHLMKQALDLHVRLDVRYGEAITLDYLGTLHRRLARHAEAIEAYQTALDIFRATGDPSRECATQSNLSVDLHLLGRHTEALDHARQALALQQRLGDRGGEASLQTNLGLMLSRLGQHDEAIDHSQRALELHRMLGSLPGEAHTLANLATSFSRLGRHREAISAADRAVEIAQGLSAAVEAEASALNTLGEAHALASDPSTALRCHEQALAIATAIGDSDESERARTGIRAVRRPPAGPVSAPVEGSSGSC